MKKTVVVSFMLLFLSNMLFLTNAQPTIKGADVATITFNHNVTGDGEIIIKFVTSSETINIDKGNGNVQKIAISELETDGKTKVITFTPLGKTINIYDNGLKKFICSRSKITSLDVSNCPKLDYLVCASNSLKTLDVSKNPGLIILNCSDNQLTSLTLKNNNKLQNLYVDRNELNEAAIANIYSNLSDRSNATKKGKLTIYRSHRKEKNSYDASKNTVATAKGWEVVEI